jgi:hypothetical protein
MLKPMYCHEQLQGVQVETIGGHRILRESILNAKPGQIALDQGIHWKGWR